MSNSSPQSFGAIGDGSLHPLSSKYSSLSEAQAAFPGVYLPDLSAQLDRCALQAWLNAGGNFMNGFVPKGQYLDGYIPGGYYLIDFPLLVTNSHCDIYGQPRQTWLEPAPQFTSSPIFHVAPASPAIPPITLGPSLVSGPGGSYCLNGGTDRYLNLADLGLIDWLGTGDTWTFEFFLKLSGPGGYLMTIGGSPLPGPQTPLSLYFMGDYLFIQSDLLTCENNRFAVAFAPFSDWKTHEVALTYNGSAFTLFVDGQPAPVVIGSPASSGGPFQVTAWMDWILGPYLNGWPEGDSIVRTCQGTIDSLQVSNTVRYTGPYAPHTSKFQGDQYTLFLCNFDQVYQHFLRAYSNSYTGWTYQRYVPNIPNVDDTYIHDLMLNWTGSNRSHTLEAIGATQLVLENLKINSRNTGIHLYNNCYNSLIQKCDILSGTAGIIGTNSVNNTKIKDSWLISGVGIGWRSGNVQLENLYLQYSQLGAAIMETANCSINGINIDEEAAPPPWCIYLGGVQNARISNSGLYYPGINPPIYWSTGNQAQSLTLDNNFIIAGKSGFALEINDPNKLAQPVSVLGNTLTGGQWCSDMTRIKQD